MANISINTRVRLSTDQGGGTQMIRFALIAGLALGSWGLAIGALYCMMVLLH
jgi:hypothetical protein